MSEELTNFFCYYWNIIFDCNSWIYFNRNIEFYSTKN